MNNLIIDAANEKILFLIISKKWKVFLKKSNIKIQDINNVFVNQGPGKFSGIRASIAAAKGICIGNNLDLYGFNTNQVEGNDYSSIMRLFERGILIKNLIKPHYLS